MGTSTHIHVDHNTQRDPIQASSSTFTLVSSDTCIHSTYLHQFFKMPPKSTTTKPKAASEHASYQDMITDAIVNLKDRNGSSRIALKAGVEKGVFAQPKGSSGGTKLAKKEPKPAAAKAAPKPKAPKKEKAEAKPKVAKPKAAAKPKKAAAAKPKAPKKKATPKKA